MKIIENVLTPEEVSAVTALLKNGAWRDAEGMKQGVPVDVKHNEQLGLFDQQAVEATKIVVAALRRSREFREYADPETIAPVLFSRYFKGMFYQPHYDAPIYNKDAQGNDLACFSATLFLKKKNTYSGGELCIEGEEPVRLNAGSLVVYSAGQLHGVSEVTRGTRIAAIMWIKSRKVARG